MKWSINEWIARFIHNDATQQLCHRLIVASDTLEAIEKILLSVAVCD